MSDISLALVIGNNYQSNSNDNLHLINSHKDANCMAKIFRCYGFDIFERRVFTAKGGVELRNLLERFYQKIEEIKPSSVLFYFSGHAFESDTHSNIFLLGEDYETDHIGDITNTPELLQIINVFKELECLSVIISDACRTLNSAEASGPSAARAIKECLQESNNTYVVLTSQRGKPAYDGLEQGPFVQSVREITQLGTSGMNFKELLEQIRMKVSDLTYGHQRCEIIETPTQTESHLLPHYQEGCMISDMVNIELTGAKTLKEDIVPKFNEAAIGDNDADRLILTDDLKHLWCANDDYNGKEDASNDHEVPDSDAAEIHAAFHKRRDCELTKSNGANINDPGHGFYAWRRESTPITVNSGASYKYSVRNVKDSSGKNSAFYIIIVSKAEQQGFLFQVVGDQIITSVRNVFRL